MQTVRLSGTINWYVAGPYYNVIRSDSTSLLDNGNIISYTRNQHNVSVTIVMSSVECRGYEERLIECSYNNIREMNCDNENFAGVSCMDGGTKATCSLLDCSL